MEAVLSNTDQSHSPKDWLYLVEQDDPNRHYVVTAVSHYEEPSRWPDFQPEHLVLVVQPHPDQPQPATAPILIKVSRTMHDEHARPARLGLWGATDDTVTIMGPATDVQLPDKRLHQLTWTPAHAPPLTRISRLIACVHYDIPQRSVPFQSSCHAFARAVPESVHVLFDGTVAPGSSSRTRASCIGCRRA